MRLASMKRLALAAITLAFTAGAWAPTNARIGFGPTRHDFQCSHCTPQT